MAKQARIPRKGSNSQVDAAMAGLNSRVRSIQGYNIQGLLAAALVLQRDAQMHVPVEYGVLKQSAFTRKAIDSLVNPVVEVGFSAAYAPHVHENLEMKLAGQPRPSGLGVYWGPRGESKFLEKAALRKQEAMVRIVQKYARQGMRA